MKPTKPCANCGVIPKVNHAGGLYWIDCKNPECWNPMHQREYHAAPEVAIAVWDAPRWYEPPQVDEVPPLDAQRRESTADPFHELRNRMRLKFRPNEWRRLYLDSFDVEPIDD